MFKIQTSEENKNGEVNQINQFTQSQFERCKVFILKGQMKKIFKDFNL